MAHSDSQRYLKMLQMRIYEAQGPLFPALLDASPSEVAAIFRRRHASYGDLDAPTESYDEKARALLDQYRREPWNDPFLSQILQYHLEDLLDGTRGAGTHPNIPFFGALPTGDLNAYAIRVEHSDDYLIVFNSGLVHFLNQLAKLAASALEPLLTTLIQGDIFYSTEGWITQVAASVRSRLGEDERLRRHLARLIEGYAVRNDPFEAGPLYVSPVARTLSFHVIMGAERFILGHELSHVFLAHLSSDGATTDDISSSGVPVDVVAATQEKELAADIGGAGVLSALVKNEDMAAERPEAFILQVAGVPFFFQAVDLFERTKLSLQPDWRRRETHPAPFARLSRTCLVLDHALLSPLGKEARRVFYGWMNTWRVALEELSGMQLFQGA